jgi:MFS family permease
MSYTLLKQVGTLISHITWSMSSVFLVFLISRIIGGISKANVSICIAIMTDISANKDRSSVMALVGIAFSIGFLIGPCIGAIFSSMLAASSAVYIYPSYMAIGLTILNICFVARFYEETLAVEKRVLSSFSKTVYFCVILV